MPALPKDMVEIAIKTGASARAPSMMSVTDF